ICEAPWRERTCGETRHTHLMPRTSNRAGGVLAVLLFCLEASALEPNTVRAVGVRGGAADQPLPTQAGHILDPVQLGNDVQLLWPAGRFAGVWAESVDDGETLQVVFRLEPKHSVRLRRIEVKPPTPGIQIQFPSEAEIDQLDAHRISASVRNQLERSGYP